jgi:hypothetical protein
VIFRSAFAACVVSALVLVWAHRFVPISDYPDWIYQGSIAAELVRGNAPSAYSFTPYPVPYSVTVILMGLLDFICWPEVSGKIVLSLCIVALAMSSTYLLNSLRRDPGNPLLLVPLLYLTNTYFFWGELNYILGLALFFFYCGYIFRRTYRNELINWWFVSAVFIALFFCHIVPFAIAVLLTVTLFISESHIAFLYPFILCLAPSIGLTIWYTVERLRVKLSGPLWTFWTMHQIAGRVIAAFSPFPAFLPWLGIQAPGMKLFALLNLLVTILMICVVPLCVLVALSGRWKNRGILACAIVCGVAVVVAGYAFAGMNSPGERFLYPAVWIGLCWLIGNGLPVNDTLVSRGLTAVLIVLLACQIAFLQINVSAVSNELEALYSKLRAAGSQTEFCAIYETYRKQSGDLPHRTGLDVLLTNHASAPRLPYYIYLERNVQAPIFQITILNYTGPGDNEDLCKSP